MHLGQTIDRRRDPRMACLQLQREKLRIMARLVQVAAVEPQVVLLGVRGEKPIQAWAFSKGTLSTLSKRETSADGVVDAINNWAEG